MDPELGPWLMALVIGILIGLYYYHKNKHGYWDRMGLNGPKSSPFFGHIHRKMGRDRLKNFTEWSKRYGKVYGTYTGFKPDLVIADAEILQQICIKDFDVFPNHLRNEFFNHYQRTFLFSCQDDHWKRVRALMSPTFTSGKIKRMFQLLDECADELIDCFQEQFPPGTEKTLVNMKDTYNLFTMDAIATCCYGLKLERANSKDLKMVAKRHSFVEMALKIFDFSTWRFVVGLSAPKKLLRLLDFQVSPTGPFDALSSVMKQLVDKRRASGKKLDDYLQLLIDAKLGDKIELNEMDLKENHHAGLTRESLLSDQEKMVGEVKGGGDTSKHILSENEIVVSAMFLLVVGLETTSNMLTICSYLLSFHPEVQEKLYHEVSKNAVDKDGNKGKAYFSYEALTSCQYLDAVISESLRYLSPAIFVDRVASRDYHIDKYNLDIPKGCLITLALYAIMNDPDYWPEPEKFDPERFMPGNKENIVPGSYCPFGIGPRHCLGMRFSLTEGKLALAKTIMKYRFEPGPEATFPPELDPKFGLANLKHPDVHIIPRIPNASH